MGDAYDSPSSFNDLYERPAILSLVGDVDGLRVVDAGCAAGVLSQALVRRGACVQAFDVSPTMAALARSRLGDTAEVRVVDLAEPLDFRAVREAGFVVDEIAEPMPVPELAERDPEAYRRLTTRPWFLFVRATT